MTPTAHSLAGAEIPPTPRNEENRPGATGVDGFHADPPQCCASARVAPGSTSPTAHTLPGPKSATSLNPLTVWMWGGRTVQPFAFRRRAIGLRTGAYVPPTAQTSFASEASTALSTAALDEAGLATTDHALPSQCSSSGYSARLCPAAQTFVCVSATTPPSRPPTRSGVATWCHADPSQCRASV